MLPYQMERLERAREMARNCGHPYAAVAMASHGTTAAIASGNWPLVEAFSATHPEGCVIIGVGMEDIIQHALVGITAALAEAVTAGHTYIGYCVTPEGDAHWSGDDPDDWREYAYSPYILWRLHETDTEGAERLAELLAVFVVSEQWDLWLGLHEPKRDKTIRYTLEATRLGELHDAAVAAA